MAGAVRWGVLLGGLAASAAATALLWILGVPGFFLFLFLPFLFSLRLGGRSRGGDAGSRTPPPPPRCPRCGYPARAPDERFCPRDGQPLADPPQ